MRLIIRYNTYNYTLPNIWHVLIRQCIDIFRLVSLTSTIVTAVYNDFLENLVSLSFAFSQKSYERATSLPIDVSRERKLHRFHGTESHRSFETVRDSIVEDYKFPKIPRESRIHTRRILLAEKSEFSDSASHFAKRAWLVRLGNGSVGKFCPIKLQTSTAETSGYGVAANTTAFHLRFQSKRTGTVLVKYTWCFRNLLIPAD